jgi:hypothetical protein
VSGSFFGALYWSTRTPFSPVRSREGGADILVFDEPVEVRA